MILSKLEIGMSKGIQKKITEAETAMIFGSGAMKDLLATPALAALMIEAAIQLVDPLLPDNYFTIGKILNINHLEPTIKGMDVTVSATVKEIKNNKITLDIVAYDELGEVGIGHHVRYVVKSDLLNENVEKRTKLIKSQPW